MIFVDTSAWLALADSKDRQHQAAAGFNGELRRGRHGKPVTTNYVLSETITLIRRRLGVDEARIFADTLGSSSQVELFWIERVHHNEAMELMANHPDKQWSLTDCTSFVVMRALGIAEAFTFDSGFVQAGLGVRP